MARRSTTSPLSALVGWLMVLAALAAAAFVGKRCIDDNPQHVPWTPLRLADPVGRATAMKLSRLVGDPPACRALLTDASIAFRTLPSSGSGACALTDRTVLSGRAVTPFSVPLRPAAPVSTCAVAAALALWLRDRVQPAAQTHLGQRVVALEHFGTVNCRRIGGGSDGTWSEHATGNAIDISAFILADGRRVSILDHWSAPDGRSAFLRAARDGACQVYGTTLSPDYNRAHADHLHFDMAARSMMGVCR